MPYLRPQVILRQEFEALPAAVLQPLEVCVVGPERRTFDYADAADRLLIALGAYDPANGNAVAAYPARPANATVDPASAVLTLENVRARYATLSGTNFIERGATPSTLSLGAGTGAAGFAFTAGANPRVAALGLRDVAPGDRVSVRSAAGTPLIVSRVVSLVPSVTAAAAGSFSGDAANLATQSKAIVVSTLTANGDHAAAENTAGPLYVGALSKSVLTDTYTLTCITGGVGTAAVFSVTSLSGDNVSSVTAPALGGTIAVGTRGLVATLSGTGAYVVGEKYRFVCTAAFASQNATVVSPAFTGAVATTYELKVVRGGTWSQGPAVAVSATNGSDYAGARTIAFNTSFPLGTQGVTAKFATSTVQNGLLAGDVYRVTLTPAAAGSVTSVLLADPLPSSVVAGDDLQVDFEVFRALLTVPAHDYPEFGNAAFVPTADGITVAANLSVLDASVFNSAGSALQPIPVVAANMFLGYAILLTGNSGVYRTLSDLSAIEGIFGDIDVRNPLGYGVYKALLNSQGQPVHFVALDEDSLDGYARALATLEKNESAYFVVPATGDLAVADLVKAHVLAQSAPGIDHERVAFVGPYVSPRLSLYGRKVNGTYWQGSIGVEPSSSPARYTRLNLPGAAFVADGVRAGDRVRTFFALDASGAETYLEAAVGSVLDGENLILAGAGFAAPAGSTGVPVRVDLVRTLTRDELAAGIAAASGAYRHRRFYRWVANRAPGPNAEPGWAYAAGMAGLKSGVAPHQGVTNANLVGFSESLQYFTPTQLDVIAGGGTGVITQDAPGGTTYVRHQLSTDNTDANHAELSVTTNVDSIGKFIRVDLRSLIGTYNRTAEFLQLVWTLLVHKLEYLHANTRTATAGPQVAAYDPEGISVVGSPVNRTLTKATIKFQVPYPNNNLDITLDVV